LIANWPIRRKLLAILVLPVVAAAAVGGFRVSGLLMEAERAGEDAILSEAQASAADLGRALAVEQLVAIADLLGVTGGGSQWGTVGELRVASDEAVARTRSDLARIDDPSDAVVTRARSLSSALERLASVRGQIDRSAAEAVDPVEIARSYTAAARAAVQLGNVVSAGVVREEVQSRAATTQTLASASRYTAMQDALVLIALSRPDAAPGLAGELRAAEVARLGALSSFATTARSEDQLALDQARTGDAGAGREQALRGLQAWLAEIATAGVPGPGLQPAAARLPLPAGIEDWPGTAAAAGAAVDDVRRTIADDQVSIAIEARDDTRERAVVDAGLVLVLLGLGLAFTAVVARQIVRPLQVLQDEAMDLAGTRLPEAISRVHEGGRHEATGLLHPVAVDTTEETGRVARAIDAVGAEALRLAGEQEETRRSVNQVFANLSRRSQSLVERQLQLIERLENRDVAPDQLSELFTLDHLATRMRRNNDNLLVLAGGESSRALGRPQSLLDIARAAISEIEQYGRIDLHQVPSVTLHAAASRDLIHLLAELLDNATSFSDPRTTVTVTASGSDSRGVTVEIIDSGVGIPPEDLDAFNEKLSDPPEVDPAVPRQMGLFVVSRLAARHGFVVRLHHAAIGLVATTLLPWAVIAATVSVPSSRTSPPDSQGSGLAPGLSGPWVSAYPGRLPAEPPPAPLSIRSAPAAEEADPDRPADPVVALNGSANPPVAPTAASRPLSPPSAATPRDHTAEPDAVEDHDGSSTTPAAGAAIETTPAETPMFFEVSAWFQAQRGHDLDAAPLCRPPVTHDPVPSRTPSPVPVPVPVPGVPTSSEAFATAADDGWRAAARPAVTADVAEVTTAGLPRRVPRARLIPGSVTTASGSERVARRDPARVQGRLGDYQRGLRRARARAHERRDEETGPQPGSASAPTTAGDRDDVDA
jgi:signal transduction histidine kinase